MLSPYLQKWYYESVLEALYELRDLEAYKELRLCVDYVFNIKNNTH